MGSPTRSKGLQHNHSPSGRTHLVTGQHATWHRVLPPHLWNIKPTQLGFQRSRTAWWTDSRYDFFHSLITADGRTDRQRPYCIADSAAVQRPLQDLVLTSPVYQLGRVLEKDSWS